MSEEPEVPWGPLVLPGPRKIPERSRGPVVVDEDPREERALVEAAGADGTFSTPDDGGKRLVRILFKMIVVRRFLSICSGNRITRRF